MKKRAGLVLFVALLIIFSASPLITAQEEPLPAPTETQKIDSAYLWLTQQVDGRWSTLTTDIASLALLALGYDDRLSADAKTLLLARENKEDWCWPSDDRTRNCRALDTAYAVLALNSLGQPVEEEIDWLLSMQAPFRVTGINWLLQIDTREASNCTVKYDNNEFTLSINEDKKYSWAGPSPSCLNLRSIDGDRLVSGNEWISISNNCLDRVYSVSCESSAAVSLPYFFNTLYVSAETFTSPTDVSINTVCIREGAVCSYEATLWTAYALQKAGREYTQLLPYLIGEADNNRAVFPDAILFSLTSKEEHATKALSQQNREGYFMSTGGKGRYWDTALGILGLIDYSPDNVTKAKDWLLKNQNTDGSFGTTSRIRDTALVLYSGWPKGVTLGRNDCEDTYGYFCRSACNFDEQSFSASCLVGVCCRPAGEAGACSRIEDCGKPECVGQFVSDVFGRRGICESQETVCNDNFDNDNDGRTDLDDSDCAKTCFELGGEECTFSQDCDGNLRTAIGADRCCIGNCVDTVSTCSSKGGFLCSEDESCGGNFLSASDASASRICCSQQCSPKRAIWPYILILVLLALAGAIFFLYKKGYLEKFIKFKGKPAAKPEEKFPPYRPPVRPYYPEHTFEESRKKKEVETETESELKETMEKLKKYTGEDEEDETLNI